MKSTLYPSSDFNTDKMMILGIAVRDPEEKKVTQHFRITFNLYQKKNLK